MTIITGTVVDTSGHPVDGVLWASPGEFRADGGVVYAPQRIPYPIENGEVSVDLAPGPARLAVQSGGPPRSLHVLIPTAGPVTLASLIGDS